jgi:hypothetical protein
MKSTFVFLACIISACHNKPTAVDQFRDVDSSLGTSKAINTGIIQHSFFDSTIVLIEDIKRRLLNMDSESDKIGPSDYIIVDGAAGKSLYDGMMAIYRYGMKQTKNEKLKMNFEWMMSPDAHGWLIKFFYRQSTVAACTILNKFQNDVAIIENL